MIRHTPSVVRSMPRRRRRSALALVAALVLPGAVQAVGDAEVRALLDTLPGGEAITSQVTDGIVTLTGSVTSQAEQDRIEEAVVALDGVISVVGAIVVEGE